MARRAGVSKSTASRVLSGGYVSGPKRAAVEAAMSEMGFTPSAPARMLATNRSGNIGLYVPDFSDPFYSPILRGAASRARVEGMDMVLFDSIDHEYDYALLMRRLNERRLDGIITLVHTPITVPGDTGVLSRIVSVGPVDRGTAVRHVEIDYAQGAIDAVEHLVGLGHTRIAHVSGPDSSYPARLRREGYTAVMLEKGLTPWLSQADDFTKEEGYLAAGALLTGADAPTAIFAVNDKTALGVWAYARTMGIDIPRDLSLVGFDGLECLTLTDTPLTTVAQPLEEMGSVAVGMLMEGILGGGGDTHRVRLSHRMVIRGSTGAPPPTTDRRQ